VLDAAIANVALPTIAGSLHVTPAMSVLIVTSYQTALVMALLPCAALGESLGYRRVFTATLPTCAVHQSRQLSVVLGTRRSSGPL
jgi:MFS family permease